MELLFDIDDAGILIGKQFAAHPLKFAARETGLGNIDGGACEVRGDDVAFSVGGVAIDAHQTHLVLNGANRGTDHERRMELTTVRTREVGEKVGGPGTAVAAVVRQSGIDSEGRGLGNTHQRSAGDAILKVSVVFDPLKVLFFRALVLAHEGVVGTAKRITGNAT